GVRAQPPLRRPRALRRAAHRDADPTRAPEAGHRFRAAGPLQLSAHDSAREPGARRLHPARPRGSHRAGARARAVPRPPRQALRARGQLERWRAADPRDGHGAGGGAAAPPARRAVARTLARPPGPDFRHHRRSARAGPHRPGGRAKCARSAPGLRYRHRHGAGASVHDGTGGGNHRRSPHQGRLSGRRTERHTLALAPGWGGEKAPGSSWGPPTIVVVRALQHYLAIALLVCVVGAVHLSLREVPLPDVSHLAPAIMETEPLQEMSEGRPFAIVIKGYTYAITPRATYDISGLVVSQHRGDAL